MLLHPPNAPPRAGITRVDATVAGTLIVLTIGLLIPACHQSDRGHTRTQETSNLKNISLGFHFFHDTHKRLPFNGAKHAVGSDFASGSWAFQILPYIDQEPLFQGLNPTVGVAAYISPARERSPVETGFGAWTDYFINNYVNDPENAATPNNADSKRGLLDIADGTSNTVMVGQGNIATGDYAKTNFVAGSHNIYVGGGAGTMRAGPNWKKGFVPSVTLERDSTAPPDLANGGWGGPYPQGGLMAMGDATVRMFPYAMTRGSFGAFLTPTGGEKVELPDS